MSQKLTLNLQELNLLNGEFQMQYADSGNRPSFYNELAVPWIDFREAALSLQNPSELILKFIHRYDLDTNQWYLSVQPCQFSGYAGAGNYMLAYQSPAFDLRPTSVAAYSGGLQTGNNQYYDPAYFTEVMNAGTLVDLDTHVRSVAFSWEEIKQLHCDNKSSLPAPDDSLFTLCFTSISFDASSLNPAEVLVDYPHSIALHMRYNGSDRLDNNNLTSGKPFNNKAADYNTLCPSRCGVYVWPAGLVPKNC